MFNLDAEIKMIGVLLGGIALIVFMITSLAFACEIYKTKLLIGAAEAGKITVNLNMNGGK